MKYLIVRLSILFMVCAGSLALPFLAYADSESHSRDVREVLVRLRTQDGIQVLTLPKGVSARKAAIDLMASPDVLHAEPNNLFHASTLSSAPNDALYAQQPYLENIQASGAWSLTTGSPKVTVAVLDSGVDINHPDLKSNIWTNSQEIPGDGIDNDSNGFVDDVNGWDFINDIPDPNPKFGGSFTDAGIHHGTLIAGLIAGEGNNKIGIAGVNWRSKILPLRVLNNRGEGDILTVIKAIEYAIDQKVSVLNLSFVGETDSPLLKETLKRAYIAGIVIVAASGNDEANRHGFDLDATPLFPACYHDADFWVISVASLDGDGSKANYSNYGRCIDISAPGTNMVTTQVVRYEQPGFETFYGSGWSGTSLSTALVSGAAALVKSINPLASPKEVFEVLTKTCDKIDSLNPDFTGRLGCGELNISSAIRSYTQDLSARAAALQSKELEPLPPDLAIASLDGKMPLRLYGIDGKRDEAKALLPFDPYRIGYTLSASPNGTVLVAGAGPGSGPQVRIFDRDFTLVGQFFAYDKRFRGGVSIAVGDIDGDGVDDIVTAPGQGGGPHVRVFDQEGHVKSEFFAYPRGFRGGLRVALADANGDGRDDIIITPIRGPAEVKLFSAIGQLMTSFTPYPKSSVTSLSVSAGDVTGDGEIDIVTAPAVGMGPVRIFSSLGRLQKSFYPYDQRFRGGISLAVGDLNQDKVDDIAIVPISAGGPHVRIFSGEGALISQFFPFPKTFRRGLRIAIVP